jgi:hypothetical protein
MSVVAAVVVFAFGLCLIAFPGVAFTKPAIAEGFLSVFASSARAHYVEQVFRLLVGGGTCRTLADYVATQDVLAPWVGHRR